MTRDNINITCIPPGFKQAHAMAKAAQDWEIKTMALAQTIGTEQARKLVEDAESLSVSTAMSRGQALDVLVSALWAIKAAEHMGSPRAKPQPFRMTLGPAGEVITQGGEW